jgi:PAS domain S-box-containing protein
MANRQAENLLEMNRHEIIGKTPRDIHTGDKAEQILSDDKTVIESRTPLQIEDQLEVRGEVRTFLGARFPLLNPAGEPYAVCTVAADITQRKKAEDALRESEQRYRTLVEQLPTVTYTAALDEASTTLYVSPQIEELIGFSPEEYKADPDIWRKRLHPDDRDRVLKAVTQGHAEKEGFTQEYRMIGRNGRVLWFRDQAVIVKDQNDQPLFLQGVMHDITEQKRTEEALRYSEERFRLAMEATNDALWDWNMVTNEIYRNPRHATMLGYEQGDIPASEEGWEGLIHPDDRARVLGALKGYLAGRTSSYEVEYRLKTKPGDYIWVLGRGKVVAYGNDGAPVRMIGTNIDITERKKAEDALRESEQRYRTLVEGAGETIATVDSSGVFTFMNTTAAKRLGGTPKDLTGKSMWDLFPKEIADRQAASIRKVITTGQEMNVIVPTFTQGQLRWYNTTMEPLRDGSGEVTAALVIARDVHELMQAQEKVRTLSSAVEQSIDGVAMGDAKSQLFYVNEAFARMHGYSPHEMIGMRAADLHPQEQRDSYEQIFTEIRKGGSYSGQAWHARKDGTVFPCFLSVTLIKGDRTEVTGTVALCRDMTETRRKEEELSRYRAQMARAEQLASLGTLSATVAHQITQPLTVIRLSLENALEELEGTSCPEKAVRKLQDSVTQVSSMTDIINRFRNFARQSSDTRFGQVSVPAVAERVVRLLEESARQARVTLHAKGMSKLPCVTINETDLEQLFFALLENAIQAADGTQARRVVISGTVKNEQVELRFCDNCGGIAPEIRDRLFEPFFTTKPRGHGTGLGLCIVNDAVTRVGGHIRLESKLGKGTTFFVTLPVYKKGA